MKKVEVQRKKKYDPCDFRESGLLPEFLFFGAVWVVCGECEEGESVKFPFLGTVVDESSRLLVLMLRVGFGSREAHIWLDFFWFLFGNFIFSLRHQRSCLSHI